MKKNGKGGVSRRQFLGSAVGAGAGVGTAFAGLRPGRAEALRLYSREKAWYLGMEDRIGTLEPGKYADLAVLDRDYFSVPDDQVRTLRSLLTLVGGQVVHATPGGLAT
jgi:predicted amidohydrolase YtcJ